MVGSIFLWAFFPIVTKFSISSLSPLFSASISTFFAFLFFAVVLTFKRKWHEILRWDAWWDMFWSTFFIGILFYAFIFLALSRTTAGNVSILSLSEILFSFLFLSVILKHETFILSHFVGALLMITGALFVLFQGEFSWNRGDVFVILATMVAPFGNIFQQRARKKVSASALMLFRSCVSAIFLLVLAFVFDPFPSKEILHTSFVFLLINGLLILGFSKIFWVEAIHRIRITKALSLETFVPVLTLILAFFFLHEVPTLWQICGLVPLVGGSYLLLRK